MAAQRGWMNAGHDYVNVMKPCRIHLNFIVDSTNGNGLGIRSLKSNGFVENVFMHTSATPGSNAGFLNPNPAVGFAVIQLKNNFQSYLGGFSGFVSPIATATKIDNSALTIGQAYVISTLGNATLANWQSIGINAGVVPAVGSAFIATAVGVPGEANTSTSRVELPTVSGITSMEVVGDTNQSYNSAIATNAGMRLIVQFLAATNSSTTTLIPAAPAAGSVVGMTMFFDQSSVNVDGL